MKITALNTLKGEKRKKHGDREIASNMFDETPQMARRDESKVQEQRVEEK